MSEKLPNTVQRVLDAKQRITGDHWLDTRRLARLNQVVRCAIKLGHYAAAVEASNRTAAFIEQAPSQLQSCRIVVTAWINHGLVLELDDRLPEALRTRLRALEHARRLECFPVSQLAALLVQIAQNLRSLDRNDEASSYLEQARICIDGALGRALKPRGLVRAQCLLRAMDADLLGDDGKMEQAEALKAQALAGWRQLYPTCLYPDGHPDLANAITDYGWIAGEKNDDIAMAERYAEALAANERLYLKPDYPNGHPHLANAYNNMGYAQAQLGRFVEAELFYAKAISLRERLYPAERFPNGRAEMAVSYVNLGEMLLRRGDLFKAQEHYGKALAIRQKLFPPEAFPRGHTDLLRVMLGVGKIMIEREAIAEAIPLYERAYIMARALYPEVNEGSGNIISAWIRHDYGRALMLANNDELAREILKEADQLYQSGSSGNFLHASTLAGLAELSARRRQLDECRDYAKRALHEYETAYPSSEYKAGHFNLANGFARLAQVAVLTNDPAEALSLVCRAQEIYNGIADRFFFDGAMMEGLLLRAELARLPALLMSLEAWSDRDALYRAIFQTKGAVRRTQALKTRLLLSDLSRKAGGDLDALRRIRSGLARLLYAPFVPAYAAGRRERFNALVAEKELAEQRLSRHFSSDLAKRAKSLGEPSQFLEKLPCGTVFLDILRFAHTKRVDQNDRVSLQHQEEYSVFVLDRTGVLALVNLGSASEIDNLTKAWRDAIDAGDDVAQARAVSAKIWAPFQKVIPADTRTILLSPDGELHRLPWLALENEDGRKLLELYALSLATEPWLFNFPVSKDGEEPNNLAVGNVCFGAGGGNDAVRRPLWEDLVGTKTELERVSEKLASAVILERDDATAANVAASLASKQIIHIATHGFFLDATVINDFDVDQELVEPRAGASQKERRSARRHSRLLSGMAFAGANRWPVIDQHGFPSEECPILTAEQIAGINMNLAQLVVLSTCESNLGVTFEGEGVLGHTAAFHESGAKCVVSSLWPVPDEQTAGLMEDLYENFVDKKMSAPAALRAAQLRVLQSARSNRVSAPTAEWAGFMSSISTWSAL